jgi:hypothetical protein
MKEGFDKEIDLLLGRYARGAAKSFAGGDGAAVAASSHLDADELGAFAEGALPTPARLAAASHLADCDRCRGVAVALSRALGGGAELKQEGVAVPPSTETEKPAAWRAWVATLFSPRVLRFAAPVLALSVVAVVSFVALRSRNAGSMESTMNTRPQTESSKPQPNAGTAATAEAANENREGLVVQDTEDASRKDDVARVTSQPPSPTVRGPNVGEVQPETPTAVADETSAAPPPVAAASPEQVPVEIAKAAPRPAAVEESEQPSKSEDRNKEKSGRAAEPADEGAGGDLAAQQRARVAQNRANNIQMPDGGSRDQKRSADNNTSNIYGGNAGTSAPPSRESERDARGAGAPATRRPRAPSRAEQRLDDDEATRGGETREAAGHRFRREGSAWVDVKYKSSMPSTGVRRGSEAFRALVADVPLIGRVAEQIGGEVVVVVSGRAYRIR